MKDSKKRRRREKELETMVQMKASPKSRPKLLKNPKKPKPLLKETKGKEKKASQKWSKHSLKNLCT